MFHLCTLSLLINKILSVLIVQTTCVRGLCICCLFRNKIGEFQTISNAGFEIYSWYNFWIIPFYHILTLNIRNPSPVDKGGYCQPNFK